MWVLIVATTFLGNMPHSRKNLSLSVFMKSAHYSCQSLIKPWFSGQCFKEYWNTKLHDNPSNGSRVVPCGQMNRRADRHDEANSRFFQFCKCPKKWSVRIICSTLMIRICEMSVTVRVHATLLPPQPVDVIYLDRQRQRFINSIGRFLFTKFWSMYILRFHLCVTSMGPKAMYSCILTLSVESVFVSSFSFNLVFLVAFSGYYV
jgi:hypothetical protein